MSELYELVLRWPHKAKIAIVTGTFDQWTRSHRMKEDPFGFIATVRVPWESKVLYKFFVDGDWATTDNAPTEADPEGNINNVYHTPTNPKKTVTPPHVQPAARKPTTTPIPAPEKPVEAVNAVTPPVHPVPVVPGKDIKPVDTPPRDVAGRDNAPAPPLFVVPVNDPNAVDNRPPDHPNGPSTHVPLVLNPPSKKEEEKVEPKHEEIQRPNGTTNGTADAMPAPHPPATPVKDNTIPTTPTAAKGSYSRGSTSSSPTSNPKDTISIKDTLKKKRKSFIKKVKEIFTPEKEKGHRRALSHD